MAGLTESGRNDCYNGTNGGLRGNTRYFALFVGDPDSGGTEVSTSGTGYARLRRTASQMLISSGTITISAGVWTTNATGSWGQPTHVAAYDAATGGNRKWSVAISPALPNIASGSRVFANNGDIEFQIPLS